MQRGGLMNWGSAGKAAGNCHTSRLTLPFSLIDLDRCQKLSQGSRDEAAEWQVLIDSPYKERNFGLSAWKAVPPSLLFSDFSFFFFFKAKVGKENKKGEALFPLAQVQSRGSGFCPWGPYVCSRGPSPWSRPCICTCMSLPCCSRWRSRCSGSDPKSTHPRLKHNGNTATRNFWAGERMQGCGLKFMSLKYTRYALLCWSS